MSVTLAIVGCGPRLEVALATPGCPAPGLVALAGTAPRSELVMAAVDLLLAAAGLEPAAIDGIVATRGPGSFTGIRVALATAQGLAMALGARGHAFSSLLAQAARSTQPRCLAVQPARRGHVYAQAFELVAGLPVATDEPRMLAIADLVASDLPVVAPSGLELAPGTPVAATTRSTAEALLELLAHEPAADLATLTPVYLEPAPALPVHPKVTPWPPSQPAS